MTSNENPNDGHTPHGFAGDEQDEQDEQEDTSFDPAEYDSLLQLERLETLEEDMVELGVTTLDEVRQRIATLHREVDADE